MLHIFEDHIEDRATGDLFPILERHLHGPFQKRFRHRREFSHLVARDRFGLGCLPIPPDKISPGLSHLSGNQNVGLSARRRHLVPFGHGFRLVFKNRRFSAKHFLDPQEFQVVGPNEKREIGETSNVISIVEFLPHDDITEPQCERRGGAGADDDSVVGFYAGGGIFTGDHHHLSPFQSSLGQPMRVRHLRRHPVHPPHHHHASLFYGVEIELHGLLARHHGMARGKIGMPGVIIPAPSAQGVFGLYAPKLVIEQGHGIGHSVQAENSRESQKRHAAAELKDLRPRPLCGLNGFLFVSLLQK